MVSLTALNPVLACLDIKQTDRIVAIRESGNIDSNFILSHLIKQIFNEDNHLCFVILHNTITHYYNVGKRLGYDLTKRIDSGCVKMIEPIRDIVDDIDNNNAKYIKDNHREIVEDLYRNINNSINELLSKSLTKRAYLIIDDISHLLDLGIDYKLVLTFLNYCLNLINNERIYIIINTHVCSRYDEIIANNLNYCCDVFIDVQPLKTGYSKDVTGMLIVEKSDNDGSQKSQYHFKTFDKGVKTFNLGESIYNLYR